MVTHADVINARHDSNFHDILLAFLEPQNLFQILGIVAEALHGKDDDEAAPPAAVPVPAAPVVPTPDIAATVAAGAPVVEVPNPDHLHVDGTVTK